MRTFLRPDQTSERERAVWIIHIVASATQSTTLISLKPFGLWDHTRFPAPRYVNGNDEEERNNSWQTTRTTTTQRTEQEQARKQHLFISTSQIDIDIETQSHRNAMKSITMRTHQFSILYNKTHWVSLHVCPSSVYIRNHSRPSSGSASFPTRSSDAA